MRHTLIVAIVHRSFEPLDKQNSINNKNENYISIKYCIDHIIQGLNILSKAYEVLPHFCYKGWSEFKGRPKYSKVNLFNVPPIRVPDQLTSR